MQKELVETWNDVFGDKDKGDGDGGDESGGVLAKR